MALALVIRGLVRPVLYLSIDLGLGLGVGVGVRLT